MRSAARAAAWTASLIAAALLANAAEARPQVATRKVLQVLARINARLVASKYSHVTRVNEAKGVYDFDCSGMVAWVLRRTAPQALSAVSYHTRRDHPLARDYYARIAATPVQNKARWGWRRVARVDAARPGDVIAWLKPRVVRSTNTGHVAFIVERPRAVTGMTGAYLVRVADASRYRHSNDSRRGTGRTGFGFGTILVLANPDGAPVGYGWVGLRSAWWFPAKMVIGQPVR